MSEERFDRLEKMMEQLIKMVGNNNAVTEELRQRMDILETNMATKEDIARLDTKINKLEAKVDRGFEDVMSVVNLLAEKAEKVDTTLAHHSDMLDVLAARVTHQDAEIYGLKKAK